MALKQVTTGTFVSQGILRGQYPEVGLAVFSNEKRFSSLGRLSQLGAVDKLTEGHGGHVRQSIAHRLYRNSKRAVVASVAEAVRDSIRGILGSISARCQECPD